MNTSETPNGTAELDEQIRNANEAETAKLLDLPVIAGQETEVKGGLLPAVQKVREAAARLQ
jgi:hypothetical protein